MYYKDLTPFEYHSAKKDNVLNVGWLSHEKPYVKGIVSDEFLQKLKKLKPTNLCRGSHTCDLCDPQYCTRGNGEIRVTGDGVTYVAPALIAHYVEAHYYEPPDVFIRAVLSGPDSRRT